MTTYTVATRGSRLSLAQTARTIEALRRTAPDSNFEVVRITTKGDTSSKPLFAMDRRGIFEKEVDAAVADGRADFAVHSLKDVPTDIPPGLILACVPRRAAPNDIIICREGMDPLSPPAGSVVGTSSLRRAAQAALAFPGVEVRPIRGNVDTRVSKVGGDMDAVILAQAGVDRLGLEVRHAPLSPEVFVPSPGQGALAVVARADDHRTISLLESIQHQPSRAEAEAERALSRVIESGCRFPVGAHARSDGRTIRMVAAAYSADGKPPVVARQSGTHPESVGVAAGRQMLEMGAASLALNWRRRLAEWGG